MILWMTKNSITTGYSFWHKKPKPVMSNDFRDMYFEGEERLTHDVYWLDKLFPYLTTTKRTCIKKIELTHNEDGSYTIKEIKDEAKGLTEGQTSP